MKIIHSFNKSVRVKCKDNVLTNLLARQVSVQLFNLDMSKYACIYSGIETLSRQRQFYEYFKPLSEGAFSLRPFIVQFCSLTNVKYSYST